MTEPRESDAERAERLTRALRRIAAATLGKHYTHDDGTSSYAPGNAALGHLLATMALDGEPIEDED